MNWSDDALRPKMIPKYCVVLFNIYSWLFLSTYCHWSYTLCWLFWFPSLFFSICIMVHIIMSLKWYFFFIFDKNYFLTVDLIKPNFVSMLALVATILYINRYGWDKWCLLFYLEAMFLFYRPSSPLDDTSSWFYVLPILFGRIRK